MSSLEMVNHRVDLFTSHQCWRGDISMHSDRRLSDFFNDQLHNFAILSSVTLLTWDRSRLVEHETFATMNIHLNTIVAAVRNFDPIPQKPDPLSRIQKQPVEVVIYAPPFTVQGQMHVLIGTQIYDAIEAARLNFVTLTHALIMLEHTPLLPLPAELILVNRRSITAFRAQPTAPTKP